MKKQIIPKNGRSLVCLIVVAVMTAAQALMAQTQQAINVNSEHVLRLLAHQQVMNILVNPSGINGEGEGDSTHTVVIGKGDILTIHGTVDEAVASDPNNPNANARLDYVELTLVKTKNWIHIPISITTADRTRSMRIHGDELNNNAFDFHLTGDSDGQQRLSIKSVWIVNGQHQETQKYPLIVTVR